MNMMMLRLISRTGDIWHFHTWIFTCQRSIGSPVCKIHAYVFVVHACDQRDHSSFISSHKTKRRISCLTCEDISVVFILQLNLTAPPPHIYPTLDACFCRSLENYGVATAPYEWVWLWLLRLHMLMTANITSQLPLPSTYFFSQAFLDLWTLFQEKKCTLTLKME